MLKRLCRPLISCLVRQPPSGGCVLKLKKSLQQQTDLKPAAFRRLCVETHRSNTARTKQLPAAFRRLCVETSGAPEQI